MDYKYIIYEKEGEIARIILNRPDKLNAFDFPGDRGICYEFDKALDQAAEDDDLKVVIIKGAGRAFCAGHDLERVFRVYEEWDKEPGKRRPSQRARLYVDKEWLQMYLKLLTHPRVTIAQVHGYCIGEGMLILEHCDMAVVAEDAHLSHAEQRLGFAGSGAPLIPLFQTIGYKRARWMLLTGEAINGVEAERIGLVNKAVPLDQLMDEAKSMAKKIAKNSAFSLKMIKRGLLMAKDGVSLEALMDYEVEACLACVSTKERKESLKEFDNRKTKHEEQRS